MTPQTHSFEHTLGTLTIRRSSFTNGIDAVAVEDAMRCERVVVEEDSAFRGRAGMHWDSILNDLDATGQDVTILSSSFIGNGVSNTTFLGEAVGYLATNRGTMPSLEIRFPTIYRWSCIFVLHGCVWRFGSGVWK